MNDFRPFHERLCTDVSYYQIYQELPTRLIAYWDILGYGTILLKPRADGLKLYLAFYS